MSNLVGDKEFIECQYLYNLNIFTHQHSLANIKEIFILTDTVNCSLSEESLEIMKERKAQCKIFDCH